MFENLTNKLGNVFNALKKRGALTEKDVDEALKDAQEKGFAEADSTLDINGEDSAHKLSILNSIVFSEISN